MNGIYYYFLLHSFEIWFIRLQQQRIRFPFTTNNKHLNKEKTNIRLINVMVFKFPAAFGTHNLMIPLASASIT